MPISAILFGGRRATDVPLVTEAFDWHHGVFLGSIMALREDRRRRRHRRRAAPRPVRHAAVLRLQHGRLLRALARRSGEHDRRRKLPKIFCVNWFRKDDDGKFLWPGFGENSRVLKWVVERVRGHGRGRRDADRARARARAASTPRGSTSTPRPCPSCFASSPRSGRPRSRRSRSTSRVRRRPPAASCATSSPSSSSASAPTEPGRNRMATRVRRPQHTHEVTNQPPPLLGLQRLRRGPGAAGGARARGRRLGHRPRARLRRRDRLGGGRRALPPGPAQRSRAAHARPLRPPHRPGRVRPVACTGCCASASSARCNSLPWRDPRPGAHVVRAAHVLPLQPARHRAVLPDGDQLRGRADDAPGRRRWPRSGSSA